MLAASAACGAPLRALVGPAFGRTVTRFVRSMPMIDLRYSSTGSAAQSESCRARAPAPQRTGE